jgi:site-specific DNA-methyltransferase (adenine-specific)
MQPYYTTPDGSIRIFHARWEDVRDAGVFVPKDIALVHADPPYGVNEPMKRAARGRVGKIAREGKKAYPKDYPEMLGDDKPFDPAPLLALDRPLVSWGANHYASRMPDSPSWLIWDKRDDTPPDNNADVEMAWSNLGGPARRFVHLWRGLCRASEFGAPHIHATQKPEALSAWVFAHAMARKKLKRGDTILVPYMGSGPDLRPAQAMGFKVIACEVAEEYCRTAVNARLRAVAAPLDDSKLGPLFEARS